VSRNHKLLAVIFGTSGLIHFVRPSVFEGIVPRWLPAPRTLVYVSGAAELACTAGLLTRQPWAGPLSAGVLLGVWPANIQMAVDATRASQPWWRQVVVWARVPLQLPMLRMAVVTPKDRV
jgi:uncharacterized membrane protein